MMIQINSVDLTHDDFEIFGTLKVEDEVGASLKIDSFYCTKETIEELCVKLKEAYDIMFPEHKEG
jgi:hypothetical protein